MSHNPYFNRWFSAMYLKGMNLKKSISVTILILIDGFLQYIAEVIKMLYNKSHNPYFNRWFSAISVLVF